jgi:kinesin family protein 6/9
MEEKIKIYARVRPTKSIGPVKIDDRGNENNVEQQNDLKPQIHFHVPKDETQGLINNSKEDFHFSFDHIFGQKTSQEEVFDLVAKDVIDR